MQVKCKVCGNKKERNDMYKIVVDGKNQYYCTEKEYINMIQERNNRNKVVDLCFKIIGETTNTALFKELSEIAEIHRYEKLLKYLEYNNNNLEKIMNKQFSSEYGKIRYFMTIVKNNIGDFKEQLKKDVNKVQKLDLDISEIKYIQKSKRKSLNDYIDEEE